MDTAAAENKQREKRRERALQLVYQRGHKLKMLRRKPTRLELKIDDTEEFESVKKELEARGHGAKGDLPNDVPRSGVTGS